MGLRLSSQRSLVPCTSRFAHQHSEAERIVFISQYCFYSSGRDPSFQILSLIYLCCLSLCYFFFLSLRPEQFQADTINGVRAWGLTLTNLSMDWLSNSYLHSSASWLESDWLVPLALRSLGQPHIIITRGQVCLPSTDSSYSHYKQP